MDSMALLRIFHILFGVYWVGSDIFTTFILLPRLKALGPSIERPVLKSLIRVLPPTLMASSVITVGSGIWLIGKMKSWAVLLSSNWGLAIFIGLVLTGISVIIGFGLIPPLTMRYEKVYRSLEGGTPTESENKKLDSLTNRVTVLARINTVLMIVVVICMAIARYI